MNAPRPCGARVGLVYTEGMNERTLAPEQQMRSLRIIWTALLASPLLLMGVFHFVRTTSAEPGQNREVLVPMLAISCVLAVVAPVAGRFVEAAMLRGAGSQEEPPRPVAVLTGATLVRSAMGEGVAVHSAVTYFITGSPWVFVPFVLGLATVLWARPTYERLEDFHRQLGRGF